MRKLLIVAIAVISITFLATMAQANLIANGSFEQLPLGYDLPSGSYAIYGSIPGWTASYGGIEVRNDVAGVAQDGDNFVELDAYSNSRMFSQTVATEIGAAYTLSYYYSPRPGVAEASNGIEMYVNDVKKDFITAYNPSSNPWVQRTFTIYGTGSDVIAFVAVGDSDSYGGSIDNVSMERASAVPEPMTLLLLGLGLSAVAGVRRFKK